MLQLQLIRKQLFLNQQPKQQYILRQQYERCIVLSPIFVGIKRYFYHSYIIMSIKLKDHHINKYNHNCQHHYYHSQRFIVSKRKQQQKSSSTTSKNQRHHHIQTGIVVGIYATICGIGSAIIMANDNLLHNLFVSSSEPK
jgi:hypothetical protein